MRFTGSLCDCLPFREANVAIAEVELYAQRDNVRVNKRTHATQTQVVEGPTHLLEESVRDQNRITGAEEYDLNREGTWTTKAHQGTG